jgi:hypothetical protein
MSLRHLYHTNVSSRLTYRLASVTSAERQQNSRPERLWMRWGHRDHQENRVVERMRSASCMRQAEVGMLQLRPAEVGTLQE